MNVPITLGAVALFVVAVGIAIEISRGRERARRRKRYSLAPPKRRPHLERRMLTAFAGPRRSYGECFTQFSVWQQFETTRMDVSSAGPWLALNLFTRSLIVRHLWSMLQRFSKSTVVVYVDAGAPEAMIWNQESTDQFNDCGVQEPWAPAKGRAGTLISGL
jgi:hypothetical protein